MLDPRIVEALVHPVRKEGELSPSDEQLLTMIAEGRPIKVIAAARKTTPADVSAAIDKLFMLLAEEVSAGARGAVERLKMLHQAIIEREQYGESLSRLLPGGLAEKLRREGRRTGETEKLLVTVLMSDIRGYSTIAEMADPTVLAGQLNEHRAEMTSAVLSEGGTLMQFVGDAVLAVFGAPIPQEDHCRRAFESSKRMHNAQRALNETWVGRGLAPFHLGIGLSTGEVAAAFLGSEERLEYSVVGDTVNLSQRLQQLAEAGQIVLSDSTYRELEPPPPAERLEPTTVKGRQTPVSAYRIGPITA